MASREMVITGAEEINFAPCGIAEEVVQNVRMILRTLVWAVPLDRTFGINV